MINIDKIKSHIKCDDFKPGKILYIPMSYDSGHRYIKVKVHELIIDLPEYDGPGGSHLHFNVIGNVTGVEKGYKSISKGDKIELLGDIAWYGNGYDSGSIDEIKGVYNLTMDKLKKYRLRCYHPKLNYDGDLARINVDYELEDDLKPLVTYGVYENNGFSKYGIESISPFLSISYTESEVKLITRNSNRAYRYHLLEGTKQECREYIENIAFE